MLFPVAFDVAMARWPWMNWLLMFVLFVVHVWAQQHPAEAYQFIMGIEEIVPEIEEHPLSLLGHMFLHADFWHLFGNLLFMWVFGNVACAKLGQLGYLALWIGTGLITGIIEPYGLGASGAINGIVGFCLIFYPVNDVTVFYFFIRTGTFALSSFWLILLWLGFDLLGMAEGDESVAYLSHVSGLATGAIVAAILLKLRILEAGEYEQTLFDRVRNRRESKQPGAARVSVPSRGVLEPAARLHVKLGSGTQKHLAVSEFLRHESQGKPVNHLLVSEDGSIWTTFGDWRCKRGV